MNTAGINDDHVNNHEDNNDDGDDDDDDDDGQMIGHLEVPT